MIIEDKGSYVERTPETQEDIDFLVEHYGAKGVFKSWCTAHKPPRMRINWRNGRLEAVPTNQLHLYR